ncbi:hypothetical protein ACFQFC_08690 [Amorphoplanes digitatis]|uniref:Esterase-like activity of phytase family protein n=1 Tax=Actinoplanes digitatis TaxID=1868 RepID=A0A7W7MS99_9ACTN|nr:hypothetical protein [Actinoplanes digitatis]MBB4764284.1 hypothetical protein [Actinoplanes digitatis]
MSRAPVALRATTVLIAALIGIGVPVVLPGRVAAAAADRTRVCRIGDGRLTEISGLAETGTGYVVVNDGSDEAANRRIFFLDRRCSVVRAVRYPSRPRDTEDLALAADGTVWVADIGDNGLTRTTIAVWRLAPDARRPQLYRLSYPDGPHDAEALLLSPTGAPIVVTKSAATAAVYVPDAALRAGRTTPLRRAGSVTLPLTTTGNPYSLPGRLVVTGGAVSPDGRRAVLRTYADAFEFDVAHGDVVRAITTGTPRIVALPDEPQGESVAYRGDGTALLTVSEVANQPPGTKADVWGYPLPDRPAVTVSAAAPSATAASTGSSAPSGAAVASAPGGGRIPAGAWAVAVILAAGIAVLGIVAARRRRQS